MADNQRVHAGDPLILLDPADWQARLDQAKAAAAIASNLEARVGRCAADQLRTGQLRIIGMIADARDRRGDGPVAG